MKRNKPAPKVERVTVAQRILGFVNKMKPGKKIEKLALIEWLTGNGFATELSAKEQIEYFIVNSAPSLRYKYSKNKAARPYNAEIDLLFRNDDKTLERYNPATHGKFPCKGNGKEPVAKKPVAKKPVAKKPAKKVMPKVPKIKPSKANVAEDLESEELVDE